MDERQSPEAARAAAGRLALGAAVLAIGMLGIAAWVPESGSIVLLPPVLSLFALALGALSWGSRSGKVAFGLGLIVVVPFTLLVAYLVSTKPFH